ncbi:MAG: PIN domain-containing protein [Acidimicrobiales bacterium]
MSLILDAGAFLAVERGDRDVVALIKRERLAHRSPVTHGGVVAQVWRGGSGRQAEVARMLPGVDVKALDEMLGKKAGVLLSQGGGADAIDAAIVCLADDGDEILTSDPNDLHGLAEAAGVHVELIPV